MENRQAVEQGEGAAMSVEVQQAKERGEHQGTPGWIRGSVSPEFFFLNGCATQVRNSLVLRLFNLWSSLFIINVRSWLFRPKQCFLWLLIDWKKRRWGMRSDSFPGFLHSVQAR
jgi:hypothetical protein